MVNKIHDCIQNGQKTIGTRVISTKPYIVEIIGGTGHYDYVEFLAEYSTFSQDDLENLARAAELYGMGTMIKVDYQNRLYVAQKAVASGFQAVLFTDHRNAEQVRESISALRPDTPEDQRVGVSADVHGDNDRIDDQYHEQHAADKERNDPSVGYKDIYSAIGNRYKYKSADTEGSKVYDPPDDL